MSRSESHNSAEDSREGGQRDWVWPARIVRTAEGVEPLFGPRRVVSRRSEALRDEIAALESRIAELREEAARVVANRLEEAEREIDAEKAAAWSEASAAASGELRRLLRDLALRYDAKMQEFENGVPDVCIRIARKILLSELDNPERHVDAWRALLQPAMRQVYRSSGVTVQVHPDYAELLQRVVEEIAAALPMGSVPAVRASEGIERGGALVVTPAGKIEVSIERALDEWARKLGASPREPDAEQLEPES